MSMTNETIEISVKEYNHLKDCEAKLNALEAGGVDNWVGYYLSLEDYHKEMESTDE